MHVFIVISAIVDIFKEICAFHAILAAHGLASYLAYICLKTAMIIVERIFCFQLLRGTNRFLISHLILHW